MQTVNGVTYWRNRDSAQGYALAHGLPVDRIIHYGRGYAIQSRASGPYWNAEALAWR